MSVHAEEPSGPPAKVVVVGDVMADVYVHGTVSRLCPEAPVPVLDTTDATVEAGGAGNSAMNAAGMGASVELVALVGDDQAWQQVSRRLSEGRVGLGSVVRDTTRATLLKRRYVSDGQILLRVDAGTTAPPTGRAARDLADRVFEHALNADAVLVSDYAYGTVCEPALEALRAARRERGFALVVDSKDLERFHDLRPDAVKPNYRQVVGMLGLEPFAGSDRIDQMRRSINRLAGLCGSSLTVVSMDVDGILACDADGRTEHVPAERMPGNHAVGAGDTFMAALTVAFAQGRAPFSAARFAQDAASKAVQHAGTTVVSDQASGTGPGKPILERSELAGWTARMRAQGRRVVLTNGCFDILHSGHVDLLAKARAQGDVLLVALNTDASVRRLKGIERPINAEMDRARLLLALGSVDAVTLFDEPMPDAVVREVRPDVFVKGGDYAKEDLPEAQEVERLGGRVVILPYLEGRSTTRLIERCREVAP